MGERKRPQKDCVYHAENRDVRTDTQRQHNDYDTGKRPIAPQRTQGETQVLKQYLQCRQTAGFPMLLDRLRYAAEVDESLPARFFRSHAYAKIVFDRRAEVGGDLCFQFGVEWAAAEGGQNAVPCPAEPIHHFSTPAD
jgi:hypothetical protein